MVLREVGGLQVVQDDRVVGEQLIGGCWKAIAQFRIVLRAESNQNGLVILLCFLVVLVGEAAVQRIGRLARAPQVGKLRLAFGDTN